MSADGVTQESVKSRLAENQDGSQGVSGINQRNGSHTQVCKGATGDVRETYEIVIGREDVILRYHTGQKPYLTFKQICEPRGFGVSTYSIQVC